MAHSLILAVCVIAALPLTTGLKCYTCSGGSAVGVAGGKDCLDAVTDKMSTSSCSDVGGQKAKCQQIKSEVSALGVDVTTISRTCTLVASSVADECTESNDITTCYCSTELCNGQTTLTPAIITCFISLVLALFASR